MAAIETFSPAWGSGQVVTPGASSARVQVPAGTQSLCFTSLNTVQCYVRCGGSAVSATTADYPIPVGGQVTITRFADYEYVAYIAPAGGGSLHIMAGEGF